MDVIFDLGAQAVHGNRQGVIIDEIPAAIPQPFQQDLAGEDFPVWPVSSRSSL